MISRALRTIAKAGLGIVSALVLVAIALVVMNRLGGSGDPDPTAAVGDAGSATTTTEEREQVPLPPAEARPATVRHLADGDSFDIVWEDTGDRDEVRLYGVNAPEVSACFGSQAKTVLEELLGGSTVLVETIRRDEFGRVLGHVWVDGTFVNAALVERGGATALSDGGAHGEVIAAALSVAQTNGDGLWADTCASAAATAVVITAINADAPGRDDQNPNGEWIDLANTSEIAVDLTGWSIRDESTRNRFSFPDGFVLDPAATVRVFSGCAPPSDPATTTHETVAPDRTLYWCGRDPVWNNGGDTGFLVDPDGKFADTFSYSG